MLFSSAAVRGLRACSAYYCATYCATHYIKNYAIIIKLIIVNFLLDSQLAAFPVFFSVSIIMGTLKL